MPNYHPSQASLHPAEHNTVVIAWRAASRKPSHHHQLISPATRTKTHSTCGKPLAEYPYNWSLNRVDCNGQHCTSLYCWKNTFSHFQQLPSSQEVTHRHSPPQVTEALVAQHIHIKNHIHITPLSMLGLILNVSTQWSPAS